MAAPLVKAPSVILPTWEEYAWRSLLNPPLLNQDTNHGQKGAQTQWTTPANGSWWRWTRSEITPTGGKKSGLVEGSPWEDALWRSAKLMPRPCTMPNDRWWHSGCPMPNMRPWVSGMPPWLSGLCSQDFMPHTDTSGTTDFQIMRQEACAETLGPLTGVLWDSVRELHRWMPPGCASVEIK